MIRYAFRWETHGAATRRVRSSSTGLPGKIDAMIGDQTLFHRMDMVEAGWRVVQPILDAWRRSPPLHFPNYESGTWGPPEADLLLERGDRQWRCELEPDA